jgi:VanZ family protein
MFPSHTWIRLAILAILMASTVTFFTLYERYEPTSANLLLNGNFAEGLAPWVAAGLGRVRIVGDGIPRLRTNSRDSRAKLYQDLPFSDKRDRLLMIMAELRYANIRPGKLPWQAGRLMLLSYAGDDRMLGYTVVERFVGTRSWRTYTGTFSPKAGTKRLRFVVELLNAAGVVEVRRLSLREVSEQSHYAYYRQAGLLAWALGIAYVIGPYIRRTGMRSSHLLVYAAAIAILAGTLIPDGLKGPLQYQISERLAQVTQLLGLCSDSASQSPSCHNLMDADVIADLGHYFFFALLAFGAGVAYPSKNTLYLLFFLLMTASVTEILQFFAEGRLPQLRDLMIDGAGLLSGLGLFYAVRVLRGSP